MRRSSNSYRLDRSAAVLIALAGAIHLVIAPEHWDHAPAHGLFFAMVGVAELAWGLAVWLWPSITLYRIDLVVASGLVVLWMLTRSLSVPFGHESEPTDAFAIICKLSEALGAVTLCFLIFHHSIFSAGRRAAWRIVVLLILVSLGAGLMTYGLARAAEPLLPGLQASVEQDHHHESLSGSTHDAERAAPTPEHDH